MLLSLTTCVLIVLAQAPAAAAAGASVSVSHGAARGVVASECTGCHTPKRTEPLSRFANGLGAWTDAHCYGCHAEINAVAAAGARGTRDARYYALPVEEKKLASFVAHPLAYMNAPEHVEPPGSAVPRLSPTR